MFCYSTSIFLSSWLPTSACNCSVFWFEGLWFVNLFLWSWTSKKVSFAFSPHWTLTATWKHKNASERNSHNSLKYFHRVKENGLLIDLCLVVSSYLYPVKTPQSYPWFWTLFILSAYTYLYTEVHHLNQEHVISQLSSSRYSSPDKNTYFVTYILLLLPTKMDINLLTREMLFTLR